MISSKVDNTGCFKLNGVEYEAGIEYIGKKVDVRYAPFDMSHVEVWYSGEKRRTVEPLKIGEYCGKTVKVESTAKVTRSRLLKVEGTNKPDRDTQENTGDHCR